jgi:hypothetical protein
LLLDPAFTAIAALAWLQFKHMVCDYFLQTDYQLANKGRYGHPGGLVHAGLHALGSIPVFAFYPVAIGFAAIVLIAEFVVHYHIDWLKNAIGTRAGWSLQTPAYWWAMGVDQFAHQITYLAMVAALIWHGT